MTQMLKITDKGISPIREPLTLVKSYDPLLLQHLPDFDFNMFDAIDIANQMIEVLKEHGGYGLAAPQVGLAHRLFIVGLDEQIVAFINSEIIMSSPKMVKREEGCLSFPGLFMSVERPEWIEIKWQDFNGEHRKARYAGITAQIISHEQDHIQGILFTERVGATTLAIAKQRQAKYLKKLERREKT